MTTDIRKGDLIKATHKEDPENFRQGRVASVPDGWVELEPVGGFVRSYYDIEVLERPIEKELLDGAVAVGGKPYGFKPGHEGATFRGSIQAVIEFVRAYDKKQENK